MAMARIALVGPLAAAFVLGGCTYGSYGGGYYDDGYYAESLPADCYDENGNIYADCVDQGYADGSYYGDGYYDGGYYGGGYGGGYYGDYYTGFPGYGYGWYDGFYYPGYSVYVFDSYGNRRHWNDYERRFWEPRRDGRTRDWRRGDSPPRGERREEQARPDNSRFPDRVTRPSGDANAGARAARQGRPAAERPAASGRTPVTRAPRADRPVVQRPSSGGQAAPRVERPVVQRSAPAPSASSEPAPARAAPARAAPARSMPARAARPSSDGASRRVND